MSNKSNIKYCIILLQMNQSMSLLQEIRAIQTGPRTNGQLIKRMQTNEGAMLAPLADYGKEARCKLDSWADTTCAGINSQPIYYTGQHCEAYDFHNDLLPINNIPIATVTTAWSNPHTGKNYIIIINEALYFGSSMDHSLVNSNQQRAFGIEVYDNPY